MFWVKPGRRSYDLVCKPGVMSQPYIPRRIAGRPYKMGQPCLGCIVKVLQIHNFHSTTPISVQLFSGENMEPWVLFREPYNSCVRRQIYAAQHVSRIFVTVPYKVVSSRHRSSAVVPAVGGLLSGLLHTPAPWSISVTAGVILNRPHYCVPPFFHGQS